MLLVIVALISVIGGISGSNSISSGRVVNWQIGCSSSISSSDGGVRLSGGCSSNRLVAVIVAKVAAEADATTTIYNY